MQVGHDAPRDADGLGLVAGEVVAQARRAGVHERPAQLFLVGLLADGHLDQRWPTEEDAGPALDHDRVVAHARQVGAAGSGGPEHHADRRDPLRRELRQAAELLAPGNEHVGLARQVRPSGLDEDQHREAVHLSHVHGAQELADRGGARRPAAHGRVVGDHQALGVRHLGQRHDDTAAHRVARVQAGQRAQLEHGRPRVDERLEALAHHHLAAGPVALDVLRPAPAQHLLVQRVHLLGQRAHGGRVLRELVAGGGEARADGRAHGVVSHEGRRFWRNASIPSAASAPAKSSADVAAAAARAVGPLLRRAAPATTPWWPAPHPVPTCGAPRSAPRPRHRAPTRPRPRRRGVLRPPPPAH